MTCSLSLKRSLAARKKLILVSVVGAVHDVEGEDFQVLDGISGYRVLHVVVIADERSEDGRVTSTAVAVWGDGALGHGCCQLANTLQPSAQRRLAPMQEGRRPCHADVPRLRHADRWSQSAAG